MEKARVALGRKSARGAAHPPVMTDDGVTAPGE
jgi:hypothetical protein